MDSNILIAIGKKVNFNLGIMSVLVMRAPRSEEDKSHHENEAFSISGHALFHILKTRLFSGETSEHRNLFRNFMRLTSLFFVLDAACNKIFASSDSPLASLSKIW